MSIVLKVKNIFFYGSLFLCLASNPNLSKPKTVHHLSPESSLLQYRQNQINERTIAFIDSHLYFDYERSQRIYERLHDHLDALLSVLNSEEDFDFYKQNFARLVETRDLFQGLQSPTEPILRSLKELFATSNKVIYFELETDSKRHKKLVKNIKKMKPLFVKKPQKLPSIKEITKLSREGKITKTIEYYRQLAFSPESARSNQLSLSIEDLYGTIINTLRPESEADQTQLDVFQLQYLFGELFKKLKENNEAKWPSQDHPLAKDKIFRHLFHDLLNDWENLEALGSNRKKRKSNTKWLAKTILIHLKDVNGIQNFNEEIQNRFSSYQEGIVIDNKLEEIELQLYLSRLDEANLTSISLQGVRTSSLLVNNVNLAYAQLTNASITDTEFINTNFMEADLSHATLISSDFTSAFLFKTNLSNANLEEANFFYANLINANFTNANLKNAVLIGAELEGANFTGANLEKTSILRSQLIMYPNLFTQSQIRQMKIEEDLPPSTVNSIDSSI